ncbi:MAG TPA: hypothetical protein VG347_12615, partial [Verrucomicrobiae bacterium]|nr:hypothetical protein [Verrucomicrobiae bacterium]
MKILLQVGLLVLCLSITGCETPPPNQESKTVPPEPIPVPVLPEMLTPPMPPVPEIPPTLTAPPTNIPAATMPTNPAVITPAAPAAPWMGLQLFIQSDEAVNALATSLPQLASNGVNAIIIEVGYHFAFKTHPELRRGKLITR